MQIVRTEADITSDDELIGEQLPLSRAAELLKRIDQRRPTMMVFWGPDWYTLDCTIYFGTTADLLSCELGAMVGEPLEALTTTALVVEHRTRQVFGRRIAGLKGITAMVVDGLGGIAHGLIVAGKLVGNLLGMQTALTGQQDVTAVPGEAGRRAQSGRDVLLFVGSDLPDEDWSSHAVQDTTFPTALFEVALVMRTVWS